MATEADSALLDGTSSKANAGGSQEAGAKQSSDFDAAKLQSTLETLTGKLAEIDARTRALQGDKDRGVAKANKEVDDLKRKIAAYEKLKKSGLDEDDAAEELTFREDIRSLKEQIASLGPVSGQRAGSAQSGTVDAAAVIAELGLPDLPEVAAFRQRTFSSESELLREATKLAIGLASKPQPNAAQRAAAESGAAKPNEKSVEELTKEYQSQGAAAQGNPSKFRALKEEYRKKGVPVDQVSWV